MDIKTTAPAPKTHRPRPLSPNIQIYRPQLGLVIWLSAAAAGPEPYAIVQHTVGSWVGLLLLFCFTFAFFLHLCGGIRHLIWDTVHGFELRSIYISGWLVVAASVVLTGAAWFARLSIGGWLL